MRKPHLPISSRMDKILWLLANQDLWEGFPSNFINDPRQQIIVARMKEAGLVSNRTNWYDVNLRSLISEARKLRRERSRNGP